MGRTSRLPAATPWGATWHAARRGLDGLERLFLPPICLHCRGPRWGRTPLCLACLRRLEAVRAPLCPACGMPGCAGHADWDFPFRDMRFLFRMTPELSGLVHGFKYRHLRRHIRFLCAYARFRPDLREHVQGHDALIPVPLHPVRQRERGYNQAEAIAAELARICGSRVWPRALRRVKATRSQTKLGRDERSRNLRGAFACPEPEALRGKRVLLVDDVFTTGSTAAQCAAVLLASGCESVGVLALAKVEHAEEEDDFSREMEAAAGYLA